MDFTQINTGIVSVSTTNNRTRTPEEIADLALAKIIYIGKDLPDPIKNQALAYKENLKQILAYYIKDAILEERQACIAKCIQNNQPEIADLLRSN